MTSEEIRAEIAKASFQNVAKVSSLSDEYFNTYLVTFAFSNCELQHMFNVRPLRVDGTELPESFYFINEKRVRAFMSENHGYYNLAWWQAIKKNHHQQYSCLANLYMVRKVLEGGVK